MTYPAYPKKNVFSLLPTRLEIFKESSLVSGWILRNLLKVRMEDLSGAITDKLSGSDI